MDTVVKGFKKIGIIGNSIPAFAAAKLLLKQNHDVTVFRTPLPLHPERNRIYTMTPSLLLQSKKVGLLEDNFPEVACGGRKFLTAEKDLNTTRTIWEQHCDFTTVDPGQFSSSLEKSLLEKNCFSDSYLRSMHNRKEAIYLKTETSFTGFDLIISTVDSLPVHTPQRYYADYIAWRGEITNEEIINNDFFKGTAPLCVFNGGYLSFVKAPDPNDETGKKCVIKWVMYGHPKAESLENLWVSKNGAEYPLFLPSNQLTREHIDDFTQFVLKNLPRSIAKILLDQGTLPSIERVYSTLASNLILDSGRICLIGDSAAIMPAHSPGHASRCLSDVLNLVAALDPKVNPNPHASLQEYNEIQSKIIRGQLALSKSLSQAFVSQTPNWTEIGSKSEGYPYSMFEYWQAHTEGKKWPPAAPTSPILAQQSKQFTPSLNHAKQSLTPSKLLINDMGTDLAESLSNQFENLAVNQSKKLKPD